MSAPSLLETLNRGYSGAVARKAADTFRSLLGVVLILEGAAAVAMLLAPVGVARLLGFVGEDGTAFTRLSGVLLLFVVALLLSGRAHPVRAKLVSVASVIGRGLLGIALLLLGHGLMVAGAFELAAAVGLGWLYYKVFDAEVRDRP